MTDVSAQQRESWNKFSPGWKKWDDLVMTWLRPIGDKCLEMAECREHHIILDVATGTGEPGLSAAGLASRGKVVGIDLAEAMVTIANAKARALGIRNYEAVAGDISKLAFDDGSFDAIICRHGIMFFPDMAAGLAEAVRTLKPGGRISLSAWSLPARNPWATTISSVVHSLLELAPPPADAPGVFRCAQPGTLSDLLQRNGLADAEEVEVSGRLSFESPEDYWEFMTDVAAPIAGALAGASAETRDHIKRTVCETVAGRQPEGPVSLEWSAWVASAVKQGD